MKRTLTKILILVLLVGLFVPVVSVYAQEAGGGVANTAATSLTNLFFSGLKTAAGWTIVPLLSTVAYFIFQIISIILWLSGTLLNYVLEFTVLDMREHIDKLGGINTAWKVIRDLMNISFIFLLVYEGIMLIISKGSLEGAKKFIGGIVLASLLINFSLFFTKILIDASNIVTIGIYQSIISDAGVEGTIGGLSNAYQTALGTQGFLAGTNIINKDNSWTTDDNYNKLIILSMASILILITSFVFFAISIMFITRYIVLVFLLMLSPIAYMGLAGIPGVSKHSKEWWDSLWGQLLFGPVFMLMTWVILTLITSPGFTGLELSPEKWAQFKTLEVGPDGVVKQPGMIELLFNFTLVIGLAITSIVTAKKTATQGSKQISSLVSGATGYAGTAMFGSSAWLGRRTAGRLGKNIADDATLQGDAKTKTGLGGAWARTKLYTARTARDATFDARNATVPTSAIGDLIEGTVGRTERGKKMGLNNVNISNIAAGAPLSGLTGFGKGGTSGYRDEQKAHDEAVRKNTTANASELSLAEAKRDIIAGANAPVPAPGTHDPLVDAMETSLSKQSEKQTEALVTSNRDLLKSQNFANAISVKQLEFLMKSEQLSDAEKDLLKDTRFSDINSAMTTGTPTSIASVRNGIRGLSDSEIEMLDTSYLGNEDFVSHLKSGQMESINKSPRFSSSKKAALRNSRQAPLNRTLSAGDAALAAGNTALFNGEVVKAKAVVKGLGHKEVAALAMTNLTRPTMLKVYNSALLKRLADEMSPSDIPILRDAILGVTTPGVTGDTATMTWLGTPDGAKFS